MKITADGHVYSIDRDSITNREFIAIERATGLTAATLGSALEAGSMIAMTSLVWIARRRNEAQLGFDDVEFTQGGFEIDFGDEEAEAEGKDPSSETPEVSTPS